MTWLPCLGSSGKQGPCSRRRRARGLPLGATGRGPGRLIPSRGDVGGQGNALGRGRRGAGLPAVYPPNGRGGSSRGCRNKLPQPSGLKQQKCIPSRSGGQKDKTKGSAGCVPVCRLRGECLPGLFQLLEVSLLRPQPLPSHLTLTSCLPLMRALGDDDMGSPGESRTTSQHL